MAKRKYTVKQQFRTAFNGQLGMQRNFCGIPGAVLVLDEGAADVDKYVATGMLVAGAAVKDDTKEEAKK